MAQDDVHLARAMRSLATAVEALTHRLCYANPPLLDKEIVQIIDDEIAEARKHTRTVLNRGKAQDDEGYITDQPGTGAHE